MGSLFAQFAKYAALVTVITAAYAIGALADDRNNVRHFDRVFVIVMENHGFDEEIGKLNSAGTACDYRLAFVHRTIRAVHHLG